MKSEGLLGRNFLKGTQGDHVNVLLSCAGHNLRLILRRLGIFLFPILGIGTDARDEMHLKVRFGLLLGRLTGTSCLDYTPSFSPAKG